MKRIYQGGFALAWTLGLTLAVSIILSAALSVIFLNLNYANQNTRSQLALNIADAGINYYLWHLGHDGDDFKDGQSTPSTPDPNLGYGPYTHDYKDDNGNIAGTFTLWIKQQGVGSTVAIVRSTGKTADGRATRTIQAEIGAPSYANYSLATNGPIWFGNTEAADGRVHSNTGIRMDGASNADVTSGQATYVPPSGLGGNGSTSRPGVWCDSSVTSPVNCNTRDKSDWRYPVPTIDFAAITADRCTLKLNAFLSDSSTEGYATGATPCNNVPDIRTNAYIPRYSSTGSFSATRGYLIELNSDNTYNLSRVNSETYNWTNSTNYTSSYTTALGRTSVANNIAIPTSGVIFVEDNLWIRSNSTFGGRVTIVAARQASSDSNVASIVAADDIAYTTKNGSDVLGLISEGKFLIAPYAPPKPGDNASNFPFKIHAAVIANSDVRFPSSYLGRTSGSIPEWTASNKALEYYGSIAMASSSAVWTWLTVSGSTPVSGFQYNTTSYDYNMQYAPPPNFPVTSSYDILSWREILVEP